MGMMNDYVYIERPPSTSLKMRLEGYPHVLVLPIKEVNTVRSPLATTLAPILQAPHKLPKPAVEPTILHRLRCLPPAWCAISERNAQPTLVFFLQSSHNQLGLLNMDFSFYEQSSTIVTAIPASLVTSEWVAHMLDISTYIYYITITRCIPGFSSISGIQPQFDRSEWTDPCVTQYRLMGKLRYLIPPRPPFPLLQLFSSSHSILSMSWSDVTSTFNLPNQQEILILARRVVFEYHLRHRIVTDTVL